MSNGIVQKKLASAHNPIIEALINRNYSFKTLADAEDKLEYIKNNFVKAKYSNSHLFSDQVFRGEPERSVYGYMTEGENDERRRYGNKGELLYQPKELSDKLIMWIRGFAVTQEEENSGYTGNFAIVYIDEHKEGKFTLAAEKLEVPFENHPHRKRHKKKHPDWGYWLFRRINKKWKYSSVQEAYDDLLKLAEDFPEVSIPSQNKLYTIVYRRSTDDSSPFFRIVLEVEAAAEGGFIIICKENTYKPKDKNPPKEVENLGKFTSMIEIKRNKRKNIKKDSDLS